MNDKILMPTEKIWRKLGKKERALFKSLSYEFKWEVEQLKKCPKYDDDILVHNLVLLAVWAFQKRSAKINAVAMKAAERKIKCRQN